MVFLAFISVKFETSKFSRVNIYVSKFTRFGIFLQSLSKMLQIIRYKIYLFIIIQEVIIPNTPLA
jgi:hypothetical protein